LLPLAASLVHTPPYWWEGGPCQCHIGF
jgi:hypothetical protein